MNIINKQAKAIYLFLKSLEEDKTRKLYLEQLRNVKIKNLKHLEV